MGKQYSNYSHISDMLTNLLIRLAIPKMMFSAMLAVEKCRGPAHGDFFENSELPGLVVRRKKTKVRALTNVRLHLP